MFSTLSVVDINGCENLITIFDLIEVNQVPITGMDEFKKIITSLNGNRGVLLLINRQGNINFVALKLN